MNIHVVGCSHHNSSVEVRERLAFSPSQTRDALGQFRKNYPGSEVVLLSTCNRVEMYTAYQEEDGGPSHQQMVEFLADYHGLATYDVFDDLFERTGEDAVRHLFTVAASIDSMVVGEAQILSQVKQAYQLATENKSTGPLTHGVFQAAVKVARRVATETAINERRVSIPSVAVVDFGGQVFETFEDKKVLVIGAGEMGEETLVYLIDQGARDITILNRSPQRAQRLAEKFSGTVAPWEELLGQLVRADLVISTTGSDRPVVTLEDFQTIEAQRKQRTLFVLDLAIPRDFDPEIGDRLGVYLYSIDDLKVACQKNQRLRDTELPQALAIVEEETARFMADLHHRATGPIIQRLRQGWQEPKNEELRRLFNKLPDLDERTEKEIRSSFDRLINKLLHPPLESLRDESRHGIPHNLLEALKRLFQLKD